MKEKKATELLSVCTQYMHFHHNKSIKIIFEIVVMFVPLALCSFRNYTKITVCSESKTTISRNYSSTVLYQYHHHTKIKHDNS